jgi:hypothetical protein
MKQLSLAQKITECLKYGTFRTSTKDEALEWIKDIYKGSEDKLETELNNVESAYSRGLVLCHFKAFDTDSELHNICQLNTFDAFVKDIVYFMIKEETAQ